MPVTRENIKDITFSKAYVLVFHCDCEFDRCSRTKMWRSDRFHVVLRASYRRSVQDSLSLALLCTILMSTYFKLKIISGLIQAFFRP